MTFYSKAGLNTRMAGVNFTCRRHMAVTRLKSLQETIRACEPFGIVENPEAQGARTALSASPTPTPTHARTKLSAPHEKGA
jgi:hypothetical protein